MEGLLCASVEPSLAAAPGRRKGTTLLLKKLEKDCLRSVDKIGKQKLGGAMLADIARDLNWSDEDFATATQGLRHCGYLFVTGSLVTLSPLGQNEIKA